MDPLNQQLLACGSTFANEAALDVAVQAWEEALQTQLVKSRHKVHYSLILRWNCAGGDTCSLPDCHLELEASEGLNGAWNIVSLVDRHMSAETYEAWCEREYRLLAGYDNDQASIQPTALAHLLNPTASSSHSHNDDADFTFPRKYSSMSASTAMTTSTSADTLVSSTTDNSTSASIFSDRPREQSSDTGCPTSPESLSRVLRLSPATPIRDCQSTNPSHTREAIGGDTPKRLEADLFQSGLDASPGSRDILSVLASQAAHRAEDLPSQETFPDALKSTNGDMDDFGPPDLGDEELPEVLLSSHEAPGSSCSTLTDLDSEMEALIVSDNAPHKSTNEKSRRYRDKTSDQRLPSPPRRSARRRTEVQQHEHVSPPVSDKPDDTMSTRALRKRRQESPEHDSKRMRLSAADKTAKTTKLASRAATPTPWREAHAPKASKSKGPRRLKYPPVKIDMDLYDRFSSRLMGAGSDSEEEENSEDGLRTQYKADGFTRDAYTAGLYTKVEWDDGSVADGDDELEEELEDDLDSALMDEIEDDEDEDAGAMVPVSSDASQNEDELVQVEHRHVEADDTDEDRSCSAAALESSALAETGRTASPSRLSAGEKRRSRSASSLVIEYVDEPIGAEVDPFNLQDGLTSPGLNGNDPPDGGQLYHNHHDADVQDMQDVQDQDLESDLAASRNVDSRNVDDQDEELLGHKDESEPCVGQEEDVDDDDGIPDSLLDTLPGASGPDCCPSPSSSREAANVGALSHQPPLAQTPQADTSGAIPPVLAQLFQRTTFNKPSIEDFHSTSGASSRAAQNMPTRLTSSASP